MRRLLCVLVLVVLSSALALAADGQVAGVVTYEGNPDPLPGVLVTVHRRGLTRTAVTDRQGRFAFSVPPGRYKLSAKLSGFKTRKVEVTVMAGETATPTITLLPLYYETATATEVRAAQR
jgi:outer membrane receptor for ferrienterochelin and colicins